MRVFSKTGFCPAYSHTTAFGCAGLQHLSATLCNWTPTNQPLASALSKLNKLTELRLANSQSLQDQELAELLPYLTLLQRLDLAECYKLTEGGVKALDFPLHLTALNLSRCKLRWCCLLSCQACKWTCYELINMRLHSQAYIPFPVQQRSLTCITVLSCSCNVQY